MNLTDLLSKSTDAIILILETSGDIAVAVAIAKKMQAMLISKTQPVQKDFDDLDAIVKPYLDILNDKSRDA